MKNGDTLSAAYLLGKLIAHSDSQFATGHPWINEGDRWKELAFALLTRVAKDIPEEHLRAVTDGLSALGLLEVEALSVPDRKRRQIVDFLRDSGFSVSQARQTIKVLHEAASSLQRNCDGKVQRLLRAHGERMVRDFTKQFNFTALTSADTQAALTYWLQNVLAMPLSLVDEDWIAFAKEHRMTSDAMIQGADEIDLNVAYLDDVIRRRSRPTKPAPMRRAKRRARTKRGG